MSSPPAADIVIPVFNEGPNIRDVLESLKAIDLPIRVLICYDFEEDNTLTALKDYDPRPM
jgi:dolichol-phosphate mannosyltransferase